MMSIETIRIDRVLAEAVAASYGMLVTRPTGAAVRGRIQAVLADSACETALLDFSAVDLLDFSCADEVVAKLIAGEAAARRYLVLAGLCEEKRDAVHHVLLQQGLAVAALVPAPGHAALLGRADADQQAAFAAVSLADAPVDAAMLADLLGWAVARAAEALGTLARLRLVRPVAAGCCLPLYPSHEDAA